MNYEKFKNWFIGLLNNLKEPMTIIMDNAPYHSVQVNKPPNQSNRKSELVKWLSENGVTADIKMLKTELIALIRRHKPPTPTYALDEIAKEKGHQVLRLPPYHCQYNAIELIWGQIKDKLLISIPILKLYKKNSFPIVACSLKTLPDTRLDVFQE